VDSELRERVRAAVAQLGYRPNRLARNLRRQQMDAIGIVVPDIANPHFAEMVRVIGVTALQLGHRVLVCNTDEDSDRQAACLRMLADERVSGIVLSPSDPAGRLDQLRDPDIPVVTIDRALTEAQTDTVVADNVPAVRAVTQRLVDAGHTSIAFVGGRPEVETGSERQEGYLDAVERAGLRPVLANGGFRRDAARAAVTALFRRNDPVSALVVANNLMALGALQAIRDCGLAVPDDIAVIAGTTRRGPSCSRRSRSSPSPSGRWPHQPSTCSFAGYAARSSIRSATSTRWSGSSAAPAGPPGRTDSTTGKGTSWHASRWQPHPTAGTSCTTR
jgi:DNA-binding LacI/PurR family transcriptional regulator